MCLDTNYLQTAGLQWLIFKKSKTRKSAKRSFKKLSTLLSKQDMGNKTPEGAREQDNTWSQRVSVQEQPMMEGEKQIHPQQFLDQKNIDYQECIAVHKSSSM